MLQSNLMSPSAVEPLSAAEEQTRQHGKDPSPGSLQPKERGQEPRNGAASRSRKSQRKEFQFRKGYGFVNIVVFGHEICVVFMEHATLRVTITITIHGNERAE